MTHEQIAEESRKHKHNTYGDSDMLSFVEGAEWMQQRIIGKACKWLKKNWVKYPNPDVRTEQLVADFRKAMEDKI